MKIEPILMLPDEALLRALDRHVKNLEDEEYQKIREDLRLRMKQTINPFDAGRPSKYKKDTAEKAVALRRSGMTVREVAKELGCSPSTVTRFERAVL